MDSCAVLHSRETRQLRYCTGIWKSGSHQIGYTTLVSGWDLRWHVLWGTQCKEQAEVAKQQAADTCVSDKHLACRERTSTEADSRNARAQCTATLSDLPYESETVRASRLNCLYTRS
jgi:hypothetical protein